MFVNRKFGYLVGSGFLWEPDELGETQQSEALPLRATMFLVPSTARCNKYNISMPAEQ